MEAGSRHVQTDLQSGSIWLRRRRALAGGFPHRGHWPNGVGLESRRGGAVLSPADEARAERKTRMEWWGILAGILFDAAIVIAGYAGVL